jgi:Zn-dependent protease
MLDLLFQNPLVFIFVGIALVISISIHEFAHAYVADKLGDPTARHFGRITLDPRAHLDPIGLLFLLIAGFGWGKPVPFNPINLSNPKRDSALIALAGPTSNIILAIALSFLFRFFESNFILSIFLYMVVFYNLILGFFNLIPAHPLDGFKVVYGILPHRLAIQWQQMESYGLIILAVLIFTHSTSKLIMPLVGFSLNLLGLGHF